MAKKRQEYDWLDDPFDEKKAAKDAQGMSGSAKTALGCGCQMCIRDRSSPPQQALLWAQPLAQAVRARLRGR